MASRGIIRHSPTRVLCKCIPFLIPRATSSECNGYPLTDAKRLGENDEMKRFRALLSLCLGCLVLHPIPFSANIPTGQSQAKQTENAERKVQLQIITCRSRDEQDAVFSKLQKGAAFSAMAKQHSTDPTGPSGGYLGAIELRHLSESLRNLVEATPEGTFGRMFDRDLGHVIILRLDPAQANVAESARLLRQAIEHLHENALDSATAELNQAVSLLPSSAQAQLMLGWAHRLHRSPYRRRKARLALQESMRLDSSSVWAPLHLAALHMDEQEVAKAKRVLEAFFPDTEGGDVHQKVDASEKETALLWALRGEIARLLGDPDRANMYLRRALRFSRTLPLVHAYLGRLHFDLNRFEEAVRELTEALAVTAETLPQLDLQSKVASISLKPEDGTFLFQPSHADRLALARAYSRLGKPKEGLQELMRLMPLLNSPSGFVFESTLTTWVQELSFLGGLLLEATESTTEATRLYRQALKAHPSHGPSHRQLAGIYYADGFYAQSVGHATKAEAFGAPIGDSPLQRMIEDLKSNPSSSSTPSRTPPRRSALVRFGGALHNSLNAYHGDVRIPLFEKLLRQPDLRSGQEADLRRGLSQELLRKGRVEEAIRHLDRLSAQVRSAQVYFDLGLAHLRQSEVQNCIGRHNAESCLLPLRNGGIHELRRPAERAKTNFEKYLELEPDSLRGRWLLNLSAMALGDYPDGVPKRHLIPPEVFESDYSIGRYRNIASDLGLDTFNLCGGSIVDDFDNDGFLDIITSTSDPDGPLQFFRNLGNGRFQDESASSGVSRQLGGLNCISADYDNDGDLDVLVLRGAWWFEQGRMRNSLLRNNIESGERTFDDVTEATGIAQPALPTQAAAWFDFDNDGDLDLYVVNESRSEDPAFPDAYPSQLFRNNGNGTFTDVADAAGVANYRYAKGVTAGDFDNDGDSDLYVSNVGLNRLYRNQGDGTFVDMAEELGVEEPRGRSFAPWFFDYDNDGWLDLFVSAYDAALEDVARDYLGQPHEATPARLYRNDHGEFAEVGRQMGLDHPYLPMGATFGDLDHDGYLDLYLGTGDPEFETLMPNVMLRNDQGQRFQDVTTSGGFGHLQKGHGISFADIDNDGDQDIYHQLGGFYPGDKYRNALFQNPGHGHHFLYLRLVGIESNRSSVGARIRLIVETPDGAREIHRAVGVVSSFGGSPLRQEVGLGKASEISKLEVWWPKSGRRQIFTGVPLDRLIQITETESEFQILPMSRIRF